MVHPFNVGSDTKSKMGLGVVKARSDSSTEFKGQKPRSTHWVIIFSSKQSFGGQEGMFSYADLILEVES